MENSRKVLQKLKIMAIQSSNSTTGNISEGNEIL
jgi:hypothetical protein